MMRILIELGNKLASSILGTNRVRKVQEFYGPKWYALGIMYLLVFI